MGNIAYNDNHLEIHQTFTPEGIFYQTTTGGSFTSTPDNLFKNETGTSQSIGDGHDIWLTLVSQIASNGLDLTVEWD